MKEREYIKEIKVLDRSKADSYRELQNNIERVRKSLEAIYNNMQFIEDSSLVDYYTYKLKAEQAQYDYLIKEARKVENN